MQHFHIFAKKTKYSVEIILRGISSLILIHCYFGLWFNAALTSEILSITVPTCSSGSRPMCATTKCHTQVHIFMSWVRPDRGILSATFHTHENAVMIIVSHKLERKCTIPSES